MKELDEIEEIIHVKQNVETTEAKIVKDKKDKQYAVRIPKRFVETMKINPKTDRIRFSLTVPSEPEEKPKLEIKLMQNEKTSKKISK